ncbi:MULTISPECIES: hypothetical protein [Kitasatospora]|uniref:Uncharacterized protein n=1 Tax=Kitasatospora cystarginea TaxID=58350 RepID=A0ABN3DS59_9ACTN
MVILRRAVLPTHSAPLAGAENVQVSCMEHDDLRTCAEVSAQVRRILAG